MEKEENVTRMYHDHRYVSLIKKELGYTVEGLEKFSNFPVEFVWKSLWNMQDKLWLFVLFNKTH